MKKRMIVIGGPTACGKTALSIGLAKKLNGEIISADSMQVYRYMDIGTAKVTKEEADGIPHYLVDEMNPEEPYNVMIFQQKAKQYMNEIWAKGKTPIVVGGTGFYINALIYDTEFTEMDTDFTFREQCMEEARVHGSEYVYEKLKRVDPEYASTLHGNNVKKVVRALEYHALTGEKFSVHNAREKEKQKESPYEVHTILLTMNREALYERIEQRIDDMMAQGLLEEVKFLREKGYDRTLVSMQGLGYKELIAYLEGETTLEEAVVQLKTGTRHFAKRQNTWFTRQIDGVRINLSEMSMDEAIAKSIFQIENN
ncbi:MAG: tRNA (adenosine(37)-N6)-dimethylallyltransferase MiaA [Bacillota bacterium]